MKKPFLNQVYNWIKFKIEVIPAIEKLQKLNYPDRTDADIEIYIDGYTEAWLDIYQTANLKSFVMLLEAVGDDYAK